MSGDVRYGGFDCVRCSAALAVVLLHAAAPYLQHPMPGLTWPVFDQTSPIVDWIGWSIELSIMPLFLMMAGYFAVPLRLRQSDGAFLRSRAFRLLLPLLIGILLILPADFYIWMIGWIIEGRIEPVKMRSLKFDPDVDEGLWGFGHLWFLHYLFFYCVVWIAARQVGVARLWDRLHERAPLQIAILGAVGWVTLIAVPQVVFGFQHAFLPVPSKWIYNGTFFVGGIILAGQPTFLAWNQRHYRWMMLWGCLSTIASVGIGLRWLDGDNSWALRVTLAGVSTLTAWAMSLGLCGWAASRRWESPAVIRYLAAASLWVYMSHHPIVALTHVQLKVLMPDYGAIIKLFLSAITGVAFSLLTFEVLVRRQPLALWLGTPQSLVKTKHTPTDCPMEKQRFTPSPSLVPCPDPPAGDI